MRVHPRRLAAGWVLAMVVLVVAALVVVLAPGGEETSAGAAPTPRLVVGSVDASGVAHGPPAGWTVVRPDVGLYEVTFPETARLEVATWAVTATVTATPISTRSWVVQLLAAGEPVDAAFSFRAELLDR